jgi:hypothetical protein
MKINLLIHNEAKYCIQINKQTISIEELRRLMDNYPALKNYTINFDFYLDNSIKPLAKNFILATEESSHYSETNSETINLNLQQPALLNSPDDSIANIWTAVFIANDEFFAIRTIQKSYELGSLPLNLDSIKIKLKFLSRENYSLDASQETTVLEELHKRDWHEALNRLDKVKAANKELEKYFQPGVTYLENLQEQVIQQPLQQHSSVTYPGLLPAATFVYPGFFTRQATSCPAPLFTTMPDANQQLTSHHAPFFLNPHWR